MGDNTFFKAQSPGVMYRKSRRMDDPDRSQGVQHPLWGSTVIGQNEGNGWLKVGKTCFLPMKIEGKAVLRIKEYVVDNTMLQAESLGLVYRTSPNLQDRDTSATTGCVPWGSRITGFQKGQDWFQVGDRYLPTAVSGISVLTLAW